MTRAPWNEIPRDLDRALSMCRLSPAEQVLMNRARELSFARAKIHKSADPLHFRINISRLAEEVQIERGRQRARMESSPIAWVRADGRRLPFADSSFEGCLNSFGEEMPVLEMLRVVSARGVLGIAQWTGEGFYGAYVELIRRFSPGPDRGEYRPDLGQEDFVRTSLAPFTESIGVQRRAIRARFATEEDFCGELLGKDPYVRPLQAAQPSERWADFSEELCRLVSSWNAADDGSVLLELKYQLTVAAKPQT